MAANNLRIIRKNLTDLSTTTITASSTASAATTTANLKKDSKSQVWRSVCNIAGTTNGIVTSVSPITIKANLIITFPSSNIIGGVILPFCNLGPSATIRVRAYTGTAPTTTVTTTALPTITAAGTLVTNGDTGTVLACPYQPLGMWEWGTIALGENSYTAADSSTGANSYSYGGGAYGRVWFPTQIACTSLAIEITDIRATGETSYIEVSRLVIGSYWSPRYNTSYGVSVSMNDTGTAMRTDSGDLLTSRGAMYKSLSFPLDWMTPGDQLEFIKILKSNGINQPLLVSLFPDNSNDWSMEQTHQIYGKLSDLSQITYHTLGMYGANINIEEV